MSFLLSLVIDPREFCQLMALYNDHWKSKESEFVHESQIEQYLQKKLKVNGGKKNWSQSYQN
jgi:hypothetical protein